MGETAFNALAQILSGDSDHGRTSLQSGYFGQVNKSNGQTDIPRQGQLGVKVTW
jgi:hypothetical protein